MKFANFTFTKKVTPLDMEKKVVPGKRVTTSEVNLSGGAFTSEKSLNYPFAHNSACAYSAGLSRLDRVD